MDWSAEGRSEATSTDYTFQLAMRQDVLTDLKVLMSLPCPALLGQSGPLTIPDDCDLSSGILTAHGFRSSPASRISLPGPHRVPVVQSPETAVHPSASLGPSSDWPGRLIVVPSSSYLVPAGGCLGSGLPDCYMAITRPCFSPRSPELWTPRPYS